MAIYSSLDTESSIFHLWVERKKTQKSFCVRPGIEPATCSSVHRLTSYYTIDFEHDIAMFKSCFRLVILVGLSQTCTKVVPLALSFRMVYKRGPSVA